MCSGPFCSFQLNYLPAKKRQLITVELHLAMTTSKLRAATLFFNTQKLDLGVLFIFLLLFIFLIKTFCFCIATELIIAQRVSSTMKHFEMWCFSFDLLLMTHSLSHCWHGKLKSPNSWAHAATCGCVLTTQNTQHEPFGGFGRGS